ncbi:FG-GAP-like repeat-containing protein [Streptomyces clavuligerus]|nr:FG-GAP-like repeat-containing protein [Streptomyces clavuligerus]ANW22458.1 esterase [Streptomyces clavuligerus]AXU17362.1 CHAP domain-containing protein [Streptomyces clavuligerus]MBY6306981.1 VCBS repeat-containing protein [Streptomyces clavuligerus]QCS10435.1 CHAP domain-containing protein [Streptomyces clavuligerus]QPJ97524.1 CHAP domain-containing protein [Streptomyces clavuligerus]
MSRPALHRSLRTGLASLVVAAALTGLTTAPAHADEFTDMAALAKSQNGNGPCAGGGYDNGLNQNNSCDGHGGQAHAWCADFVGWVWSRFNVQGQSMLTDAASSFYHYGQRYGTLDSTPDVGDAVVYGYANGWAQHVAIVTGVSNGVVTITGGNQSHSVNREGMVSTHSTTSYRVGDSPWGQRISGYIAPKLQRATPPRVSVGGASGTVSGVANLTASVTAGTYDVASVQYYVDGEPVSGKLTRSPYTFALDTSRFPDGKHTVSAEVTDIHGNTGASRAQIITSNGEATSTFHADFNGDGKADIGVLYDYGQEADSSYRTGLWTYLSNGTGFNQPVKVWDNVSSGFGSWNWDRSKITTGDFNGDEKDDVGVLYNNGQNADNVNVTALWTFTSNGTGFNAPVKKWDNVSTNSGSWNWNRSKLTSGDFNADGKDDVGVLYNNGQNADNVNVTALWTLTSTGSDFTNPSKKWDNVSTNSGSWNWDRSKMASGDFTGDGKTDVGVLYDNGRSADGTSTTALWTFASTGSDFTNPSKKWDNASTNFGSWTWDRSKLTAGDFNGDGKTDVGILYNNGQTEDSRNKSALWTLTSTGTDFTNPSKKWDSGDDSWNSDTSKLTAGDFNGDGRTDIGVLYGYGRQDDGTNRTAVWKFSSNGTGFNAPVKSWDSAGALSWNWYASKLG